jgi:hypothetical protein
VIIEDNIDALLERAAKAPAGHAEVALNTEGARDPHPGAHGHSAARSLRAHGAGDHAARRGRRVDADARDA